MTDLLMVALIVFLTIPAPLIIVMYFVTKWKQARELSASDERLIEDMWRLSQKLEDRVDSLETILNHEMPDWRSKS